MSTVSFVGLYTNAFELTSFHLESLRRSKLHQAFSKLILVDSTLSLSLPSLCQYHDRPYSSPNFGKILMSIVASLRLGRAKCSVSGHLIGRVEDISSTETRCRGNFSPISTESPQGVRSLELSFSKSSCTRVAKRSTCRAAGAPPN